MNESSDSVETKLLRALDLHAQGQLGQAESLYQEILQAEPRHFHALHLLGMAAGQQGRAQAAVDLITRAIEINPDDAAAYSNRGNALRDLKRCDEALANYDRALAMQPDSAELLDNRGLALFELSRYEEALVAFDRALAIKPLSADFAHHRDLAWQALMRLGQAGAGTAQAVVIGPENAHALTKRGNELKALGRLDEALVCYENALAIKPDLAEALKDRGDALVDLRRYDEALASFSRALVATPDYPHLLGNWLHTKMKVCDWSGLVPAYDRLAAGTAAGRPVCSPFAALGTPLSLPLQRSCAEMLIRRKFPAVHDLRPDAPGARHDRIRLGYFSADFHAHATAYLMAGLLEQQDRSRFELVGFSFGPPAFDPMRARIEAAFDQFIDVREKSDAEIARMAGTLGIDIAVDLKGFTQHARTGIFARRAAPVQVSYLGYPGTMGADYIDYLIADHAIIPEEHMEHYAEKIVFLPHCYQVNDSRRTISERPLNRLEAGLPERGFVFCCFNNNWKITPGVFDIWMRLLRQVEGSVLWLLEDNAIAGRNLRAEAEQRGVSAGRLVFAPRMSPSEHLARHRLADLFLDTLPYNAHTTASDSLWAGLPLLTRTGETFAGRVAASLLKAVGLPELITDSAQAYEALALELASNARKLAALRQRLAENRLSQPLFDTALFTRHIESAYRRMWERHQAGLAPDHIVVTP